MLRRKFSLYLILFLLSFCTGIAFFSFWQFFVDKWIFLPVVFSLFAAILADKKIIRFLAFVLLGLLIGWGYVSCWGVPSSLALTEITGRASEINCSQKYCSCIVEGGGLRMKLVFDTGRFDYRLCLPGNLVRAEGSSFSALSSKDRLVKRLNGGIKVSHLTVVSEDSSFFFKVKKGLYLVKESFRLQLKKVMSERNRFFAEGLILGEKQSFPDDFKEALKRTGTSHLVALSGFNVSILIFSLFNTLKFLSLFFAFGITFLAIIAFVLMTGASASIVRAGIMGIFLLSAQVLGRQRDSVLVLSFSLFLMALLNPFSLVWDISLQLSFLAFVGLLTLGSLLSGHLRSLGFVGDIAAENMGAVLFTLPLVAYYFGSVSWIGFLVNVLVVAVVPLATYLILATGVFGYFSLFISQVFAYLAEVLLFYILKIIEFFGRFSWTTLDFQISHFSWLFLYYLILGLLLFYFWQKKERNEKIKL